MTTPAAAPAAPAAVEPTAPAVVAAPAALVVPAPAPAPVAPAAPATSDPSLFGEPPVVTDPAAPVAPVVPPVPAPAAPAAPVPGQWFYADGTPGKGAAPEWFKADKYVSVEEQAKAYGELEKRMGAFVGAPKDGKYEPWKAPEGLDIELQGDHPLLADFDKWAATKQLNQGGRNELLTMLAQYEAAQLPDMAAIKGRLGPNADTRITAVNQWVKANLDAPAQAQLRVAGSGNNADAVFAVIEALIGKSNQVVLPKPGADIPPPAPPTQSVYHTEMNKRGPDGKALYFTDPLHRARVDEMAREMFKVQP